MSVIQIDNDPVDAEAREHPHHPWMVVGPGGTFRMRSDEHYPEEAPAHRVTVNSFLIDETPVTNRQFKDPLKVIDLSSQSDRGAKETDTRKIFCTGDHHEEKALTHRCRAWRDSRGRSGRFVPRLPSPDFYTWGYDTQLSYFLVRTSRHDNDGIERGLQRRWGCCVFASRRGPIAQHDRWRLAEL